MTPKSIRRDAPTTLAIEWDDGHRSMHTLSVLRKYCPCAGCRNDEAAREERTLLPVLSPGKNILDGITPVGSYALQLTWGDGHRTGIYTYEYLRQLCECERCRSIFGE